MSDNTRAFYGGEPVTSGGALSGGIYRGREADLAEAAPWKCPACGIEQTTPFKFGCPGCGSGKPGYKVTTPPPSIGDHPPADPRPQIGQQQAGTPFSRLLDERFATWLSSQYEPQFRATENEELLKAAFLAGWAMCQQHTMKAPPVTVDIQTLNPDTKGLRTIIAALELFRDQVLSQAEEEIASGEWMSVEELETMIGDIRKQL